jgi:uncharacterized membrane protein
MLQDRRTVTIIALALCLVYVAVRVWRITDSCLWFDELFSVHAAEHAWSSLFRFVAQDLIHPPLFYATLKLWIALGGESLIWLRLLPVVFAALAVVPFIYLCKELKLSNSVLLLSLAFLAVNGSLIKYTQTLRMYSMLMFLSLLSIWLFARYFNRGKSFIPLLIVNLLLIYTHYFGFLAVGTEIVAILLFQRIKWRRMAAMAGILFASFIPWAIAVFQAARSGSDVGQNIAWMARPGIREMFSFLFDLTEPFYFQASNVEPASIYRVSIPVLLILLSGLIVYLINWKEDADKQRVYFLSLFVLIPALSAFIVSWVSPYSVWGTRHLIVIYAPAAILLAYFLTRIPPLLLRTAAVTLLLLLSGYAFYLQAARTTPRYVWCEWENAAQDIQGKESSTRTTKIYAFENLAAYHLWFALRDLDRYQIQVVKGLDVRTDDETYFLPRGFDEVRNAGLDEIKEDEIWLAFRASKAGDERPILETFQKLGYQICSMDSAAYDTTTVYWMKLTRGDCSQ